MRAHEQHRLILLPEKQPRFWDYFEQEKALRRWGNIVFKYFSTEDIFKILLDIKNRLPADDKAAEFCRYFCQINRIADS